MELRSRVLPGIFWGGFSSAGSTLVQLAQLAILGRLLGAEEFGLVAMATVVIGLANVYADVGINNAILTHHDLTPRRLSSLYWLSWGASLLLALLVLLIAPLISRAFGDARLESLITWAAMTLLISPLGMQYQLLLQRELRIKPIALAEVTSAICGLAVAATCASRGAGAHAIVFGSLAATGLKAVLLFLTGIRVWPVTRHFSINDVKPYLGFGAYQLGERTLNFTSRNVDKILIGALLGAYSLGLYNVAYQIMQKPLQFIQPIVNRVALPLFSSYSEDFQRLRRDYISILRAVAMLMLPAFMLLMVIAEPLLVLLVGPKWADAAAVLRWLCVWGCFTTVGFLIGNLLLARRRADLAFWYNVWGVLMYCGAIAWGSRFGIEGVAIAIVSVQLIALFPVGFWLRWQLVRMAPGEYVLAILPVLLVSSVAAGMTAFVGAQLQTYSGSLSVGLLVSCTIMLILYTGTVFLTMRTSLQRAMSLYKRRAG